MELKLIAASSEQLSDDTIVAGQEWRELKKLVMHSKFRVHDWFRAIDDEEKKLVEELYQAQLA